MTFQTIKVPNPILSQMDRDRIEDMVTRVVIAVFSSLGVGFCVGVTVAQWLGHGRLPV